MEASRMQKISASLKTSANECFRRVRDDPQHAAIFTKLYLEEDMAYPLQMLTDQTHPNSDQIKALYRLHGGLQDCRKIVLASASDIHPSVMLGRGLISAQP
jgi:hypothetical protein